MADIVAKLRARAQTMNGRPVGASDGGTFVTGYYDRAAQADDIEAADLITRLRAENEELRTVNANLMGGDEEKPRYTTKRLRHEVSRASATARAEAFERAAQIAETATVRMAYGILLQELDYPITHREIIANLIRIEGAAK